MNLNYHLAQLPEIAQQLLQNHSQKIFLFYGAMGAGKTTLIKELVKQLKVEDVASSPTFSLVNEYHSVNGEIIYHFDFYRIEQEEEAYDMGIEEYFDSNAWCFVEWPEKVENLLPLETVSVIITTNNDGTRNIQTQ